VPHPAGYEAGWAFRARHFNWTCFAFYGGDIRSAELDWLHDQVRTMAALPAGDDGDRVTGLFVVSLDDQRRCSGTSVMASSRWQRPTPGTSTSTRDPAWGAVLRACRKRPFPAHCADER
jgi:hypothetical protein